MKLKYLLVSGVAALALLACNPVGQDGVDTTNTVATVTAPVLGDWGVAVNYMDQSIKPGDDFFRYVNGKWLDTTEIPADKSNYGSFNKLADLSDDRVKAIIEKSAATAAKPGSEEQKIGDFYAAFMDEAAIDAAGLEPVRADLARIAAAETHEDIAALMGDPELGANSPVAGWVDVDVKDVENYIFYVTQSGLGMPNKDYYLEEDDKSVERRAAYLTYLTTMLTEAGMDKPGLRAKRVLNMETAMARSHWEPKERRDRDKTYNKMSLDAVKKYAPGFPWDTMLNAAGLGDQTEFVIRENTALRGLARQFERTKVETLKDYLTVHYLGNMSAYLPKRIDDASFAFYGTALRGTEQQRERWKRGVGQIDNYMGEMVGKVYVKEHFPNQAEVEMDKLIENLRAAFKVGIDNLEWMGDDTKVQAQDKLAKFNPKIGYPKEWTDYSSLTVDRNNLVGTIKSANAWQWNDMIGKLGGPIDRGEWGMNPQTVNAYYRPSLNEIVFPAAILQAPFFDPNADPAVNYGGIGAVIGHEMGHGFDDQGRKVDGNGAQRDWWTADDAAAFKTRSDVLVEQFGEFEPLPGYNVDGRLTLGENIGDLTGITMAYAAYKRSLNGAEAPIIDGFTGDQRFFLAYAQIWQRKFREDELINRVKTDPHSPGEYRANGIVRNFDPWYEAFNIQPDDALYLPPEKRVKIW